MENQLQIIKKTRENFIKLVNGLTAEQLNKIPEGFSNNIAWNLGHIVAAQQSLCYALAGAALKVDQAVIEKYRKGTKPEAEVSEKEIQELAALAESNISDLEKDLQSNINIFANFQLYTTSYGFELRSINDAVSFFAVHDALHLGYAMALRKAVLNN
jgi:hypothetical protein